MVDGTRLGVPLTLFGRRIFAAWALDYVLAFLFGIAFQYFTITPRKKLSPGQGLRSALHADTLSLTAGQVGMSKTTRAIHPYLGHELPKRARCSGSRCRSRCSSAFFTAVPVSAWLIARRIKEPM